jgi:hypothetical protein
MNPYPVDPLHVPEAPPLPSRKPRNLLAAYDEMSPGERCPVTDPFWCSRDRYHPGAHVNRSATGPGMIGWLNTTEPVGFVTLPSRKRPYLALGLGVFVVGVVVALWWWLS